MESTTEKDLQKVEEWLTTTVGLMTNDAQIVRTQDQMGILFTIKVEGRNAGRLIGRESVTINALRNIARVIGFNVGARISIKVDAPPLENRRDNPRSPDRRPDQEVY